MKKFLVFSLCFVMTFSLVGCNLFLKYFKKTENTNQQLENSSKEKDEQYIDVYNDGSIDSQSGNENTNPGEVNLLSISVTPPTKLTYEMGEEFDITGLIVVANFSDETHQDIPLSELELSSINTYKLGEHNFTVKYKNKSESFKVNVIRTYNEEADSLDGINVSDTSRLVNAFSISLNNYTSKTISYFNSLGAYDYYRHYRKNYVQAKNNFLTSSSFYNYPYLEEYLDIMNNGYLNKDNNYYSFSLKGNNVSERMNNILTNEDLSLVKENCCYQDDLFTLADINTEYLNAHPFTRVSANKYENNEIEVINNFIDICAPGLINEGAYMTFRKVSIELNVSSEILYRIRLYASNAQTGKLIDDNLDQENKPNWYLLFSEALISNVGTTTFAPANSLID